MFWLLVLLSFGYRSDAGRLLLIPTVYPDLADSLTYLGTQLQDRGHEVYVLTHPRLVAQLKRRYGSKVGYLSYEVSENRTFISSNLQIQRWLAHSDAVGLDEALHNLRAIGRYMLDDNALLDQVRDLQFEIVILDIYLLSMVENAVFTFRLDTKFVTFSLYSSRHITGDMLYPTVYPHRLTGAAPPLTVTEALTSLKYDFKEWYTLHYNDFNRLASAYVPLRPASSLVEFYRSAELHFINSELMLEYAAAKMSSTVYVGGHQMATLSAPSPEYQQLCERSQPLIVICFGTYMTAVKPDMLRPLIRGLRDTGMELLIRHSNPADLPAGIIVKDQIPLKELLMTKGCVKLFVSQCGSRSQTEALISAVPVLCIPFGADQLHNSKRAAYHRLGDYLLPHQVSRSAVLAAATDLLRDTSLYHRLDSLSQQLLKSHRNPLDRVHSWLEFALLRNTSYLRPPKSAWYSFITDTLLSPSAIIVFLVSYLIIVFITRFCCAEDDIVVLKPKKKKKA